MSLRGYSPIVVSSEVIGVVRIAPVIILIAWFCILVSFTVFDFEAVEVAAMPYSMTGEHFQYTVSSAHSGQLPILFHIFSSSGPAAALPWADSSVSELSTITSCPALLLDMLG